MSTKRTRSSSTKHQSRSGSLSKPKDEWKMLPCGCLLIGNDGSKVTCREHTSPKLRETLAKSKVVRPLFSRKLETRTNDLLRGIKALEEQMSITKIELRAIRAEITLLERGE